MSGAQPVRASAVETHLDLMRALIELRYVDGFNEWVNKVSKRSKLHPEVVMLIYHCVRTTNESILQSGGCDPAAIFAALAAFRESAGARQIFTPHCGRMRRFVVFAVLSRYLRRFAFSTDLLRRWSQADEAQTCSLVLLGSHGDIATELEKNRPALLDRCWVFAPDYSRGNGAAGKNRSSIDALVASRTLAPIGLYGTGTWIGQLVKK